MKFEILKRKLCNQNFINQNVEKQSFEIMNHDLQTQT